MEMILKPFGKETLLLTETGELAVDLELNWPINFASGDSGDASGFADSFYRLLQFHDQHSESWRLWIDEGKSVVGDLKVVGS